MNKRSRIYVNTLLPTKIVDCIKKVEYFNKLLLTDLVNTYGLDVFLILLSGEGWWKIPIDIWTFLKVLYSYKYSNIHVYEVLWSKVKHNLNYRGGEKHHLSILKYNNLLSYD